MALIHEKVNELAGEEPKSCCARAVARLSEGLEKFQIGDRKSFGSDATADSGFASNPPLDIFQQSSATGIERKHYSDHESIGRDEKRPCTKSLLAADSPTVGVIQNTYFTNQMASS